MNGKRIILAAALAALLLSDASNAAGLRDIRRLSNRKQYEAAIRELEREMPGMSGRTLAEARLLRASLCTSADEAGRIYSQLISSGRQAESLSAKLELAKIRYSVGDYRRVTEILSDIPEGGNSAERYEARYFRGLAWKEIGDGERARRDFSAVDRGDFLYWSYMALAELDIRYGRMEEAIERYEMIAGSHSNPVAGFKLGECYEATGNNEKAIETYRNLARLFPESLEAPKAREKIQLMESGRRYGRERSSAAEGGEGGRAGAADRADRSGSEQYYTLQFGAFSERENAEAFVAELGSFIEGLRIERVESRGKTWHRVRVGRFESREKAEEEALRLMEKSGYSSKVLPLE